MENFLHFILTLAVAIACGYILQKLKVPAGGLVGSLLGVIVFNLVFNIGYFYSDLKPLIQTFLGINVAASFRRENFEAMKKLARPIIFILLFSLAYNIIVGGSFILLTELDVPTALFSAAPGGATDIAIIAMDYDACISYVAIIQIFRVIAIVSVVPSLAKKYINPSSNILSNANVKGDDHTFLIEANVKCKENEPIINYILRCLGFYGSCALGGIIFLKLGFSAGMLIGGALIGGAYSMWKGGVHYKPSVKLFVQVLAGVLIGSKVTRENLANFKVLLIPLLLISVLTIVLTIVGAKLLHKTTKMPWLESFFAVAPGGIMEMSIACEESGGDVSIVATLQALRMIFVIAVMPILLSLVIQFLS